MEQRLEIGGQVSRRVAAARLRHQAAEEGLVAAEVSLDVDVARAFALALAGDRRAELAETAAARRAGSFETCTRGMA